MGSNSFNRFLMAFTVLAFFFIFACSSDDSSKSGPLDGTWEMDDFLLEISGNTYLLKWDDENETKGTVTYGDSTFKFIITHEWDRDNKKWEAVQPPLAIVSGTYTREGEVSVFSKVYRDDGDGDGPYSYSWFDGQWEKIK